MLCKLQVVAIYTETVKSLKIYMASHDMIFHFFLEGIPRPPRLSCYAAEFCFGKYSLTSSPYVTRSDKTSLIARPILS